MQGTSALVVSTAATRVPAMPAGAGRLPGTLFRSDTVNRSIIIP
jgi:hypothetical protein